MKYLARIVDFWVRFIHETTGMNVDYCVLVWWVGKLFCFDFKFDNVFKSTGAGKWYCIHCNVPCTCWFRENSCLSMCKIILLITGGWFSAVLLCPKPHLLCPAGVCSVPQKPDFPLWLWKALLSFAADFFSYGKPFARYSIFWGRLKMERSHFVFVYIK